mmetsp:Transcript_42482/g.132140  ORF Transcript_42482/g.132140 Transcript_42482/m.132140 type:complete len:229 (+) Transcript_42482:139-825(+)
MRAPSASAAALPCAVCKAETAPAPCQLCPCRQAHATSVAGFSRSRPGRGAVQSGNAPAEALRRSMPPPWQAVGAGQATGPSLSRDLAASRRPAGVEGSVASSAALKSARMAPSTGRRSTALSFFDFSSASWWFARSSSARTCSTSGQSALSSACTPTRCARSATGWMPLQFPASCASNSLSPSRPGSDAASATRATRPCSTASCRRSCAATVEAQARWRALAASSSKR